MPAFRSNPRTQSAALESHVLRDNPRLSFDPRNLRVDLLVWCRSDLDITPNGPTVAVWMDMSGNGNDFAQATAIEQPTFASAGLGGRPELTFDGSNDTMDGASFYGMVSAPDDWTVVIVVRDWTWGGHVQLYYGRGVLGALAGGVSRFNLGVTSEAGPGLGFGCWNLTDGHVQAYGDDSQAQGAAAIMVGVCNSGSITMRVNGTAGATTSGTLGLHSSATTLELGKGNTNVSKWDGAVSELMIFDGVLPRNEVQELETYLSERYGVRV